MWAPGQGTWVLCDSVSSFLKWKSHECIHLSWLLGCMIAHWRAHGRCSIIINYKSKTLDIHRGVDFGEQVIRQVGYLVNLLWSELAIERTGFRQCDLFPIKRSWLARRGMSSPSWSTVHARSHLPGRPEGEDLAIPRSSPGCSRAGPLAGRTSFPLSFQELVEFYQQNSLKDCFKSLDTTLQFPFKEPEKRAISKPPGRGLRLGACSPCSSLL